MAFGRLTPEEQAFLDKEERRAKMRQIVIGRERERLQEGARRKELRAIAKERATTTSTQKVIKTTKRFAAGLGKLATNTGRIIKDVDSTIQKAGRPGLARSFDKVPARKKKRDSGPFGSLYS